MIHLSASTLIRPLFFNLFMEHNHMECLDCSKNHIHPATQWFVIFQLNSNIILLYI